MAKKKKKRKSAKRNPWTRADIIALLSFLLALATFLDGLLSRLLT
nr:MAG TPA: hypothetical protein [Caudoviricetes sp.]